MNSMSGIYIICLLTKREFDEFVYLYVIEYHVVERALKERYLKGQSVRAVIFADIGG